MLSVVMACLGWRTALAQDKPPPPLSSLLTQPGLFEPPGGPKAQLREWGIGLDAWVTQFGQGLMSGDGSHAWRGGGKGDLILNLDFGKMGAVEGLSVNVHQEILWGRDINSLKDGSLIPLNTALAFPHLGGREYDISVNLTQKVGPLTFSAGKFNLLDLAAKTPLVGGGGLDTFMNTAIAAPISGVTPPYLYGGIVTLKTDPAIFTLMVYDPRNAQGSSVLATLFSKGVTGSLSMTVPVSIGGLSGFYAVRGVYSSKSGQDLNDVLIKKLLPDNLEPNLEKTGYRYGQISFQQFLFQHAEKPGVGWGLFGDAAVSDGNPNPFRWRLTGGVGGNNLMEGRELDRWGVGYFRYTISQTLLNWLALAQKPRRAEQGIEAFYNLAITPWFRVTADVQWITPWEAAKKNAVVGAVRTQLRF